MKIKTTVLIAICLSGFSLKAIQIDDSTGVILRDNKVFILHKVEAGQGLFAVARRYKIHWTAVRDANPGAETNLLPGKILYVPTGKTEQQFWGKKKPVYSKNNNEYTKPKEKTKPEKESKTENEETNTSPKVSFTIFYTVKKGETLFSIAEKFNTTIEFLKQLNNLKTEKVKEGTDILVPFSDENKEKIKNKENLENDEPITKNTDAEIEKKEISDKDKDEKLIEKKEETKKVEKEIDDISKKIEEEKQKEPEKKEDESNKENSDITQIIKEADKNDGKKSEEITNEENAKTPWKYKIEIENYPEYDIEKVTETGQGKVMDDKTIDQTKDWVIHHNAPENTIILITNPANNKTVYVKVVKNFNRTSDNEVMIFITKNTADFLELSKKDKFNIKISFAK